MRSGGSRSSPSGSRSSSGRSSRRRTSSSRSGRSSASASPTSRRPGSSRRRPASSPRFPRSRAASGPRSSASPSRRTRAPRSRATRSSATTSGSSPTWSRRSRVPRAPGTTSRTSPGARGETVVGAGRASRRRSRSFPATTTRGRSSAAWPAKEGRWDDARAAYRRGAADQAGLRARLAGARAGSRRSRGGSPRRSARCVEGLRRLPALSPLLLQRAALLHALGRLEEARAAWREAVAADGGSARRALGLARTLSALGREEEARDRGAPGARVGARVRSRRASSSRSATRRRGTSLAAAAELGARRRAEPRATRSPPGSSSSSAPASAMARGVVVDRPVPGIEEQLRVAPRGTSERARAGRSAALLGAGAGPAA